MIESLHNTVSQLTPEVALGAKLVLILLLAWLAILMLRRVVERLIKRGVLSARGALVIRGVGRTAVMLLALLTVLENLGVSTGAVWAALSAVAVMVAVGFVAVWSILSNALCGLLLLVFAPFRIGDDVELYDPSADKGLRGKVLDMNLLFVKLEETDKGTEDLPAITQVPNNIFFQRAIRRWPGKRTQPLSDKFSLGSSDKRATGTEPATAERESAD
ncbi:mechanosensitive ion channel [bacterium]|nr:mechanosensitive ion channel [bacterium]